MRVKTAGREMVEGETAATVAWKAATGRDIVGRATAAAGRRWRWWWRRGGWQLLWAGEIRAREGGARGGESEGEKGRGEGEKGGDEGERGEGEERE